MAWTQPLRKALLGDEDAFCARYCGWLVREENLLPTPEAKRLARLIARRLTVLAPNAVAHGAPGGGPPLGWPRPWTAISRVTGVAGTLDFPRRIALFYRRDDNSFHIGFPTNGQGQLGVAALGLNDEIVGALAAHGAHANGAGADPGFGYFICPVSEPGRLLKALRGNHQVARSIRAMDVANEFFGTNPQWAAYCNAHGFDQAGVKTADDPRNQIRHWPPPPRPVDLPADPDPLLQVDMNINTILYGPPGTGKTFATTALALACVDRGGPSEGPRVYAQGVLEGKYGKPPEDATWRKWIEDFDKLRKSGQIEFTTFHQNYAYEDFVEGLRAETTEGGSVHYSIKSGVLKRIAYRALYAWLTGEVANPQAQDAVNGHVLEWLRSGTGRDEGVSDADVPRYVLVVDEINRGNMARILGELITLLEDSKRVRREIHTRHQPLFATLPYSNEPFTLPPNLYVLATMNTADRSLTGLDLALRRRFSFVELEPQPNALRDLVQANGARAPDLCQFLTALNKRIEEHLDRDHRIGHAFFAGVSDMQSLASAMRGKVIPQLMEYFHDRPDLLRQVMSGSNGATRFIEFGDRNRITRVRTDALENPGEYDLGAA